MSISGIVITLSSERERADAALRVIGERSEIELGPPARANPARRPAVIETEGSASDHELHDWLRDVPGVEQVDVVYVSIDPEESELRHGSP